MQLHLKTLEKFSTANLKNLVDETNRLEVAGITSSKTDRSILQVNQSNEDVGSSSSFTNDVIKKMDEHAVTFVRRSGRTGPSGNFRKSNFRGSYTNRDNRRPDDYGSEQRRCRNCDSVDHLVRQCPSRFCASSGQKGHDSWSRDCPRYK